MPPESSDAIPCRIRRSLSSALGYAYLWNESGSLESERRTLEDILTLKDDSTEESVVGVSLQLLVYLYRYPSR